MGCRGHRRSAELLDGARPEARSALRLQRFGDLAGDLVVFQDICEEDLSPGLATAVDALVGRCEGR